MGNNISGYIYTQETSNIQDTEKNNIEENSTIENNTIETNTNETNTTETNTNETNTTETSTNETNTNETNTTETSTTETSTTETSTTETSTNETKLLCFIPTQNDVKYVQTLDTIYEENSDKEIEDTYDLLCNKNTQTESIQTDKFFLNNIDDDIVDNEFYDAELDTISLPDQEPDDLLFTSIDEIAVLKEEILKLEQIIHKKSVNIVELNKNYRDMENKKDREIMRLNNKIDEYVDECDDLYLENMRLKSKYKSKICELFVPKIYNNIDYSSS